MITVRTDSGAEERLEIRLYTVITVAGDTQARREVLWSSAEVTPGQLLRVTPTGLVEVADLRHAVPGDPPRDQGGEGVSKIDGGPEHHDALRRAVEIMRRLKGTPEADTDVYRVAELFQRTIPQAWQDGVDWMARAVAGMEGVERAASVEVGLRGTMTVAFAREHLPDDALVVDPAAAFRLERERDEALADLDETRDHLAQAEQVITAAEKLAAQALAVAAFDGPNLRLASERSRPRRALDALREQALLVRAAIAKERQNGGKH